MKTATLLEDSKFSHSWCPHHGFLSEPGSSEFRVARPRCQVEGCGALVIKQIELDWEESSWMLELKWANQFERLQPWSLPEGVTMGGPEAELTKVITEGPIFSMTTDPFQFRPYYVNHRPPSAVIARDFLTVQQFQAGIARSESTRGPEPKAIPSELSAVDMKMMIEEMLSMRLSYLASFESFDLGTPGNPFEEEDDNRFSHPYGFKTAVPNILKVKLEDGGSVPLLVVCLDNLEHPSPDLLDHAFHRIALHQLKESAGAGLFVLFVEFNRPTQDELGFAIVSIDALDYHLERVDCLIQLQEEGV